MFRASCLSVIKLYLSSTVCLHGQSSIQIDKLQLDDLYKIIKLVNFVL